MLEKFLQDKNNIKDEHLEQAYTLLKEYCEKNDKNLLKFVQDKNNIEEASQYIHKELPLAVRLFLKPPKIAALINDNHDFIVEKAKHYAKLEKKTTKTPKK